MGFLKRLLAGSDRPKDPGSRTRGSRSELAQLVMSGAWNLEVVGESFRQAELWRLVDPSQAQHERVRQSVTAVLLPDLDHPRTAMPYRSGSAYRHESPE